MEDKQFINEYKRAFDNVHASDRLRNAVIDAKPRKKRAHVITPFKATLGTVAAAIMIFAAVNEYRFEPDTNGVISETVVETQKTAITVRFFDEEPVSIKAPVNKPTSAPKNVQVIIPTTEQTVSTQVPVDIENESVQQTEDNKPISARIGNRHTDEEQTADVFITECEPFDASLSGTIEPTETGYKGYIISNGIYYIIEGTDEIAVLEKILSL